MALNILVESSEYSFILTLKSKEFPESNMQASSLSATPTDKSTPEGPQMFEFVLSKCLHKLGISHIICVQPWLLAISVYETVDILLTYCMQEDADCYDENGDDNGMEKLYGINFIMPFEKVDNSPLPSYELPSFKHKTNEVQTFGYNFRFNIKSCTNDATKESVPILVPAESSFFDLYSEVLTKLNSFLEVNGL